MMTKALQPLPEYHHVDRAVFEREIVPDVVIGTSSYLREHSHGKDMTYIKNTALEVIEFVKSKGKEIRFSSEDSF